MGKKTAGNAPKTKKKRGASTVILVLILVIGLGIMAYPTVSDWWNSRHQSRAIAAYTTVVENTSAEKKDAMLEAAREYNARLPQKSNRFAFTDEEAQEYASLLDLSGNGIMGYIRIPSIGVNLPIYHGTEESVLQVAVGHIEWSSLPVGGEGTHAVMSGHRGLPRAKLFTDLDKIQTGDVFIVSVLDEILTYQVDQIRIVEPKDLYDLEIEPGKDLCTLVTCTPYGINTHRLLVRGTRIETVAEAVAVAVEPEAGRIPNYIVIPAVFVPLLFLFLLIMLIYYRRKPVTIREDGELPDVLLDAALGQEEQSGAPHRRNDDPSASREDREDPQ